MSLNTVGTSNFNERKPGIYSIVGDVTDSPTQSSAFGILVVFDGGYYQRQLALLDGGVVAQRRILEDGKFGGWSVFKTK